MRMKALAMMLVLTMLFSPAVGVYAAPQGEMLPIRAIFEEAAGEVFWGNEDRSINITLEGNSIVFFAGSANAYVNGQQITLQGDVIIIDSTSFIAATDLFTVLHTLETQAAPTREHETETPLGGVITGALHRIEYGGNVAYLFGSMHAERYGWFPLAYIVESAMRRADVFAFETDLSDPAMFEAMAAAALLPDGITIDVLLTPEEIEDYIYALLSFGIPEETLIYIRYENPVFLSLFISQMFMMEAADNLEMSMEQSVDSYVMSFAGARGLPVVFLEPAEQQIRLLYLPPNDVIAHVARNFPTLDELLREMEEAAERGLDINTLATIYETNDFDAMADIFAILFAGADEDIFIAYQRDILYNFRSTYYANEILRLMRETPEPTTFFITVGVSHIIRSWGGEGLTDIVEQLALQGVEAVPLF